MDQLLSWQFTDILLNIEYYVRQIYIWSISIKINVSYCCRDCLYSLIYVCNHSDINYINKIFLQVYRIFVYNRMFIDLFQSQSINISTFESYTCKATTLYLELTLEKSLIHFYFPHSQEMIEMYDHSVIISW